MVRTRDYIKSCFNQGDKPDEANFGDLFDSVFFKEDTISASVLAKLGNSPKSYWYIDNADRLVYKRYDAENDQFIDEGVLDGNGLKNLVYRNDEGYVVDAAGNGLQSNYAYNASNADWASNASNADYATNAGSAETSLNADMANIANFANLAENASNANNAGSLGWDWYYHNSYLKNTTDPAGISTLNWNIDPNGNVSGLSLPPTISAENLTKNGIEYVKYDPLTGYMHINRPVFSPGYDFILTNSTIYGNGFTIAGDTGEARFGMVYLYDGANGDYSAFAVEDGTFTFWNAWDGNALVSMDGGSIAFRGNDSYAQIMKNPSQIGASFWYYFLPTLPTSSANVILPISIQGNVANNAGDIKRVVKSLTTAQINALTGDDAQVSTIYFNSNLGTLVFKNSAGWQKVSYTAM